MSTKQNEAEESTLAIALRHFEIAEANLAKLERLWKEAEVAIPSGISFNQDPVYEDNCRAFEVILEQLPKINDWRPTTLPLDLGVIAQNRFDAQEIGEFEATVSVEDGVNAPGRELRKYRFMFNQKRKELIRETLTELIDFVDAGIRAIRKGVDEILEKPDVMGGDDWDKLKNNISQIDTLLGSSLDRSRSWSDLARHLHFAELHDFYDIEERDWPTVKKTIRQSMYGANEPIPSKVEDLAILVSRRPSGPVTRKLQWANVTSEQFERLIFSLINSEEGYENSQWLTKTEAPDRGRDLSVDRIFRDPLAGVIRQRVMIQCKHWLDKSVSLSDIGTLREQMKLWEPPKIDVHIIATSGRFTTDAVEFIEKHNRSDQALRIDMWPESHLEMLLASRPALIAEFRLR